MTVPSPGSSEPVYPANLRLGGQPVLVVGGGAVALDKIQGLLDGGADDVTVVAVEVDDRIRGLPVRVEQRAYRSGEVEGYRLVLTAVDDSGVAAQIAAEATAAGLWVNAADDPDNCTFIVPARVRRGDLLVTVSTGGRSPALSSWLRRRLEEEFGEGWADVVEAAGQVRDRAKGAGRSLPPSAWQAALDDDFVSRAAGGDVAGAVDQLWERLTSDT